jgi:hypothetical protein
LNDSIAALSPAATRPIEPDRPAALSTATKSRERNCESPSE